MEVAIMIPMTDDAAAHAAQLCPAEWPDGALGRLLWPEVRRGVPGTQEETAAYVQWTIEDDMRLGLARALIVTRSDAAFYRVRRMVAEGAAIDVKVYLVREDGTTRYDVNKYGVVVPWPRDLFGHIEAECGAILRARGGRRAAGANAAKPTEGT